METKESLDLDGKRSRLSHVIDELKLQRVIRTQGDFAKSIGYNRVTISSAINGKKGYLSDILLSAVSNAYPQYSFNWLLYGDAKPSENLIKIEKKQMGIPILDVKSQKEYLNNYYSNEFLKLMPKIMVDVEAVGRFIAFIVGDDAMTPVYSCGDTVVCREVERSEWNKDIQFDKYDFAIAHSSIGIIMREVINHDIENGLITCISNEGEMIINLKEVTFLYHIVERRVSGNNLKKNRKTEKL